MTELLAPILLVAVAMLVREAVSDWERRNPPRQIPPAPYDYEAEQPSAVAARGGRYH